MIGIKSYCGYIPFYRIKKSEIAAAYGKKGPAAEKAVAYYDEDSLTMAVAASLNTVPNADGTGLDGVYFASTTAPYDEKSCATQIAACLDCRDNVRTVDVEGSLRAFSDALLIGMQYAGSGENVLVAAADCRLGGNDGAYENDLGDGAAAFLVGEREDVIAKYVDSFSVSQEGFDMWRANSDKTVRFWDVRYATSLIYTPLVDKAVKGLLEKTGLTTADFSRVCCYAHEERHAAAALKKLGFAPEQIQSPLYAQIGNTGTAAVAITLASALDQAKSGEKILVISYGDGCNAIVLETTPAIESYAPVHTIQALIDHKDNEVTYGKYLKWKDFLQCEPQRRPAQERASQPDYFRNRKKNNAMWGSVCKNCGTPHFPPQRVCAICHTQDQMMPYRFIGRKAWLRTFTLDGQSLSLDPPNNLVVVEFEGGGKMMTFMDDVKKEDIHVKQPVELCFRRMFQADGVNLYFWKVVPSFKAEEK